MSYDFGIEHVKTEHFGNVDMLSRLIPPKHVDDEDFVIACATLEYNIRSVVHDSINTLPITHHMIEESTRKCTLLQQVMLHVQTAWPKDAKSLHNNDLIPYFNRRESLSVVDNILLDGERIVIPLTYRNRILKTLHKGHQGQQRMKAIARSHVYWPSIDKNIEDYVRACGKCQLNAKTPVKTKLSSGPIAERAMQRIHIDFAGPVRSKYYLIIVDSYSKWPEAYQSTTISTAKVIDILSDFFNRFGYPESIVSDNGTQFVSAEFQQFCKARNIRHFKTAPYHPQSNGQAERYSDIVKRALEKSFTEETKDN
ncbi:uncharacterized protein K02A2.6-like [Rhagoletis pomonella]|nr:uncharacterized protein K02A2.6-like [Rhagoletis pomonella]